MTKILAAVAIALSALVIGGTAPAHADCDYVPGIGWDC